MVWGMLLRRCQTRNFKELSALSLCRCGIDAPPILRSNGRNLNSLKSTWISPLESIGFWLEILGLCRVIWY